MASPKGNEFAGTQRFQVLSRLGEGGMGVVYAAFDRERNSRVALKTLTSVRADALMRFKNEFRGLADLHHPNLVSLGELFRDGGPDGDGAAGRWFFTMELVEGQDFLRWVRGSDAGAGPGGAAAEPGPLDARGEARLRSALAGLAQGLAALHAAGKVHRDIKPSNILVTEGGRVVVLDFGLAMDVAARSGQSEADAVGTVDYMAPEQAASKQVGPPADWYSMGVLLYEALTGRVPFQGAPLEILMDKQRFEPAPPRALVGTVAPDLDALCVELLRFTPEARPDARRILQRLGAPAQVSAPAVTHTRAPPFVGRQGELAVLRQGFERARAGGGPVLVLIEGESGVGKSVLWRQFTDQLQAESERVVVLAGRCYEREAVPYKAFDGVVDALSRFMARLPRVEASGLLPLKASLLAQVFPVLRRVEVIAQAPLPRDAGRMDPQEQRMRVFAALRELLARLAERRPLVLVIDDLQWADADSRAMLEEVLRPPDAPGILLIATARDHLGLAGALHLRLEALPASEACQLVELLWPDAGDAAAAIAAETGGHPLFIDELVRHLQLEGDAAGAGRRLEDALGARITRLEPATRHVLELAAVAGAPVAAEVLARAAETDAGALARVLALLRVAHLLRSSGGGDGAVECYHDRVRQAVLAGLAPLERQRCHERLALALEASAHPDAEALALHWQGAGQRERAARHAGEAASQAAQALAFDRAVRLYRQALELGGGEDPVRLRVGLGDALANGGRGAEAALAYLSACEAPGASAALKLDCQRRAADEYLRSGHTDEGLKALKAVLAVTGMQLARTPARALASWLWNRSKLRLRGLAFRERDVTQVSARELTQIDTCWSAAVGLGMVDNIRGADYQTRSLLLALRAGEPYRVCRAMALEAAYASTAGSKGQQRTQLLLTTAAALAARIPEPHGAGLVAAASAISAFLLGDWEHALELAASAETTLRERCTGVGWELSTSLLFGLWSLYHLGRLRELARRVADQLREAEARGNRYMATNMQVGLCNVAWLVGDSPDTARAMAKEGMRLWSRDGFQMQHYYELLAYGQIDLYDGRALEGHQRLMARWKELEASLILRIRPVGLEAAAFRGRLALGAAAETRDAGDRQRLIKEAARQVGKARGEPPSACVATLLEAGVAAARGDLERARERLTVAEAEAQGSGMAAHAWVARWRRGKLLGGDEGAALVASAEAAARAEAVVKPERFAAMMAPGFAEG